MHPLKDHGIPKKIMTILLSVLLALLPVISLSAEETAASESTSLEPALATPSENGALQVIGGNLCDENGTPVQLRGISTHGLAWYPEYVNQECFNDLADWGVNLIRLALYTAESGGYCTDGDQEALKDLIRSGVSCAEKADLYVIIDWHILSEGTPLAYQEEAEAFFAEMSAEFAASDNVLYEICNEPNTASWSDIKSYACDIIPIIRSNDPDAVIIVGTPTWSQEVDQPLMDPITGWDNLMYTLHFYAATHKEDLRSRLTEAVSSGLPVFVTEFGICDASGNGALDTASADEWMNLLDSYGISYALWNLSNKDESSSLLLPSVTKTAGFTYDDLSESGRWYYDKLQGISAQLPAETETQAPSDSESITSEGLSIGLTLRSSWEDGDGTFSYLYDVTVTNLSGEEISSWGISLSFNEEVTLTDSWNGTVSQEGTTLSLTNADYNGTIPDGESVTDIGFIIKGSSDLTPLP